MVVGNESKQILTQISNTLTCRNKKGRERGWKESQADMIALTEP